MRRILVIAIALLVAFALAAGCSRKKPRRSSLFSENKKASPAEEEVAAPEPEQASTAPEADEFVPGKGPDYYTEELHNTMKRLWEDYKRARGLYMQYYQKKEAGQVDKSIREQALGLYDKLLQELDPLADKYPQDNGIQELHKSANDERRDLAYE